MDWMLMPLRRYADFTGRSRRKEYWMFTLGVTILYALLFGAILLLSGSGDSGASLVGGITLLVLIIPLIAIIVPSVAVQVRRFHDQDKSGWFVLLGFVPYIGGLILLVFMCIEGTRGENRYGLDPKENLADVF